jgi:hypothetical protein
MDQLTRSNMTRREFGLAALALGAGIAGRTAAQGSTAQSPVSAAGMPTFQVDPTWPRIPNGWTLGIVSSIRVDERDHVWILRRPRSVPADQTGPPGALLEFDADGNFLQQWGGPGDGYDWPENEHSFDVDPNGFIWITGNNPNFLRSKPDQKHDDMLLKFTKTGRFVLQIGGRNRSGGVKDTKSVHEAADCAFYAKTNEIFVADGYGNRRLVVFDGATGAFKRMWGAFGRPPVDRTEVPYGAPGVFDGGEGPEHFGIVHAVRVSTDGLVYVGDRDNRRVQVFTIDGKYLKQVFINMSAGPSRTACGIAFSPDAAQRLLYVCDFDHGRIFVFDRAPLAPLGSFGAKGTARGEFVDPHYLATDSKGNLYSSETAGGRRAQRFIFKGVA